MELEEIYREIQKMPEFEDEVNWYKNNYPDKQPWESLIGKAYIDFNITFPKSMKKSYRRHLINFLIFTKDCEIEEDKKPRHYRIMIKNVGYLDEIENAFELLVVSFILLIKKYSEAEAIDKLQGEFHKKIQDWNYSKKVMQERVIKLTDKYSLKKVSEIVEVSEKDIPMILEDFYIRIDRKKFHNCNLFIDKVEKILRSNQAVGNQLYYQKFIIEEIKNGAANINTLQDLIPIQLN